MLNRCATCRARLVKKGSSGLFLRGVSALGKGTDGVQILNFLRLDSKHMLRVTSGSPAENCMLAGFGEVQRPRHYQVVTR